MKFIRVEDEIAIQINKRYYLLRDISKFLEYSYSSSMIDFINWYSEEKQKAIENIIIHKEIKSYVLDENVLEAPIKYPLRNIICLGKNYAEHANELKGQTANLEGLPENPIYFSKMMSELTGHKDSIRIFEKKEVDYEVELAIIIGKKGKDISEDEVEEYIFGYTIVNDITSRYLQKQHIQWLLGKSVDTFCPMGPLILTKDEVEWPVKLRIESYINDELRQSSNTENMLFGIPEIVARLSHEVTLLPGDIIATGTPKGVGMGFKPPKYLKKGDRVKCYIESIGCLENIVE